MIRSDVLLVVSLSIFISYSSAFYDELYRPQLHYSHPRGWLSDPNGLVYKDGLYHLYHQCRDNHTAHGPMQWGHAVSRDLIHWKTLPTALYPPEGRAFYSGGGVIDYHNVSGLQIKKDVPPFVVYICCSNKTTLEQDVWMAYSNENKLYTDFKIYEKQPLFPNWGLTKYFRDPTPFKYKDHFIMIVSIQNFHAFYKSTNLKDWEYTSKFGEEHGAHGGSWECASLTTYEINGIEKWVLTMTRTSFSHPNHQYFIGSFDGETFVNDNSPETVLWLDYGPDSFAGVVWYDLPDKRRVWINWMGRWEYAIVLKENAFNGQMGIPRELKLVIEDGKLLLTSYPIDEVKKLRTIRVGTKNETIKKTFNFEIAKLLEGKKKHSGSNVKHVVDIEMTLDLKKFTNNDRFDIVFSGANDKIKFSFTNNEFTMDRSLAGNSSFPNSHYAQKPHVRTFAQLWTAPRVSRNPLMKLRIIIDANCFEMFIDKGLSAMSGLFYTTEDIASKMTINVHSESKTSHIHLKELQVHEMKSIWDEAEIAKILPKESKRDQTCCIF